MPMPTSTLMLLSQGREMISPFMLLTIHVTAHVGTSVSALTLRFNSNLSLFERHPNQHKERERLHADQGIGSSDPT
jgi:hypothetical protein